MLVKCTPVNNMHTADMVVFMSLMDKYTDTTFYHYNFRTNWVRTLRNDPSTEDTSNWVNYNENKIIYICDNLKPILQQMDTHPDDKVANERVFRAYISNFNVVSMHKLPEQFVWYNKTTDCINLRPGRREGSNYLPKPIKMKGQTSHGIIAGRTGSGKSVFLNNLILNMMYEYAPWELELYLADFKKVELSRYMDVKHPSPHVRACAATSEVDYVQSLIQYIKEKKDDREKLFARLGLQNIEQFRKSYTNDQYEVVMPRILFIADEFQQLFLDSSTYQKTIINDLITDITRKGRSQGVHLLFASQDMQGALSQTQLSNFKVHFCLACEAGISSDVLGNNGATMLQLGQVIANTKSVEKADNVIYEVPLAEDSNQELGKHADNYFSRLLMKFVEYADLVGYSYRTGQKFYDEDKQFNMENLVSLLNNSAVKNLRMFENNENDMKQNFMSLVLGRKVVYSTENFDIENFYITYGKNKCVLCISSNAADLALFQRLFAVNYRTMRVKSDSLDIVNRQFESPIFFDLNPLVSSLYPEVDRLTDFELLDQDCSDYSEEELQDVIDQKFYYREEELNTLNEIFSHRKRALHAIRNTNNENAKDVCLDYLRNTIDIMKLDLSFEERKMVNTDEIISKLDIGGYFDLLITDDSSQILLFNTKINSLGTIEFESNFYIDDYFQDDLKDLIVLYYRYKVKNIRPTYKLFKPLVVILTGIENLESLPSWFQEYASNCMDYNILTMFFMTSASSYAIKMASNYIFVGGDDPKLYDDYIGKRPPKGNNALKFRCLIKNTNQCFAFKKYRLDAVEASSKSINFDQLLLSSE